MPEPMSIQQNISTMNSPLIQTFSESQKRGVPFQRSMKVTESNKPRKSKTYRTVGFLSLKPYSKTENCHCD
jgi:hypothetical protein